MNIMITGATGFLGGYLNRFFDERGYSTTAPIRARTNIPDLKNYISLNDLKELDCDFIKQRRVEVFIHCAAVAHQVDSECKRFKEVNTDLTLFLAKQAAESGVKRFIFFSSIGVNGKRSVAPFKADTSLKPYDDYTESKYRAEEGLKSIGEKSGMEVIIIRPPLIYGANAPGNFSKLVKIAKLPIPIPLGGIHNKRSFVSIDNLADFTHLCLTHPKAANQTFLVSDGQDLSTSEFLRKISYALDRRALLIPIPVSILRAIASTFGKADIIDKLVVDLQVDIGKNKMLLGWRPPISVDAALKKALSKH